MGGHEYNETSSNRRQLARQIAKFHKIQADWLPKARYLADDVTSEKFLKPFYDKISQKKLFTEEELELIEQLKTVVSTEEIEFLKKVIPAEDDLVTSHNDLSLANLIIEESNKIWLIDYEYAGRNFRGFDIGYLFHQGRLVRLPDAPYFKFKDDNFPPEEDLIDFIRYYVVFSDLTGEEDESFGDILLSDEAEFKKHVESKYSKEAFDTKVRDLHRQAKIGVLACNHYIVTWATSMCKSGAKFDHLAFAKAGFAYYQKYKKEIKEELGMSD